MDGILRMQMLIGASESLRTGRPDAQVTKLETHHSAKRLLAVSTWIQCQGNDNLTSAGTQTTGQTIDMLIKTPR
jgi:hypothetical protein